MLLEKGADPNHKNRFGFVPLFVCLNSMGEESAKLLLEFGADPTIEVGPGVSPMACSINYPRVEKILNTFFKKEVKKTRKTAKESGELKKCEGCGNSAGKRCTGDCKTGDTHYALCIEHYAYTSFLFIRRMKILVQITNLRKDNICLMFNSSSFFRMLHGVVL